MIDRVKSGVYARALRDLGLAARSGPFRVALALSVLLHVAVFAAARWMPAGSGSEPMVRLMHVRLLAPNPQPAAPAVAPAAPERRRAGTDAKRAQASTPAPPAVQPAAAPDIVEPQPAPAVEPPPSSSIRLEDAGRVAPSQPPAAAAPPEPVMQAEVPPVADPPLAGLAAAAVPAADTGAPATEAMAGDAGAASGPTGSSPLRSSMSVTGAGGNDDATSSGTTGGEGPASGAGIADAPTDTPPGPYDLAAVRRRIDARKVYPRIAVRNGWEGRVLVEMRLEGDGSLAGVRLLQGSGYSVLDEATITAVRRASPFPPVARVLTVPVEYRLVP